MREKLESILVALLHPDNMPQPFAALQSALEVPAETQGKDAPRALNAAFLSSLAGEGHRHHGQGQRLLSKLGESQEWGEIARFYTGAGERIREEIDAISCDDPALAIELQALATWLSTRDRSADIEDLAERMWTVFCPEASGIRGREPERIESLRSRRTVRIEKLNPNPIRDPGRELLFTSNILLTIPHEGRNPENLPLSPDLKQEVLAAAGQAQRYWYDHPIPVGIAPDKNEILYGLRGLDQALETEKQRGNLLRGVKVPVVLSVSTTHSGLHAIAKPYLEEEFARGASLRHLEVFVFGERETERLLAELLVPAAEHYLKESGADKQLSVLGVEGAYGRHYSFLKAIAAFWAVLVQREIRGTFKIDLDQVFPQTELIAETGRSAFEHLLTPLWGAIGKDANDEAVELGMLAGAVVNQEDIEKSVFTPDVLFPQSALSPEEFIFFSTLPQALSTEAEMMARYGQGALDGERMCLQRVHVTGGANGILVDALRSHRPFVPSFIGRAEDQAYLLSVLDGQGIRLACLHQSGLFMRHDKHSFAREAVEASRIGKLVGDYVRILYFSAYARILTEKVATLKDWIDPFTGCFVSRLPVTVTCLRFALKAAHLFATDSEREGVQLVEGGARRLGRAIELIGRNTLKERCEKERQGWDLYYDTLDELEAALERGDSFAQRLRRRAAALVEDCRLRT